MNTRQERVYCKECGRPVILHTEMTVDGEVPYFRDERSGDILDDCPFCGTLLEWASVCAEQPEEVMDAIEARKAEH